MHRTACLLSIAVTLVACRGDDGDGEALRFPDASDPDAFGLFLNAAPAVPAPGMPRSSVDNVADFPEAYYNTIDPDGTRQSFGDWLRANGFLTTDGQEAPCAAPTCELVKARFRDTKDLGYGREMTLRRDLVSDDVAVYVRNYQVDAIEGLPYGPLNAEALAFEDRQWNFSVNAIEFSSYPDSDGRGRQFAKFYSFAGDGKRALGASGVLQHAIDLDTRGLKNMPTPCIVCHGGRGRTLVVRDEATGEPRLAPTVPGHPPGDLGASLQMLEFDTFEFFDRPGFRPEDNEAAIAAINDAVLSTWRVRLADETPGGWDPSFAIELLENRYPERTGSGDATRLGGEFDSGHVPDGWASDAPALYRDIVGPNCIVCHAMQGSRANPTLNFETVERFLDYAERTDHLVFERGVMPLGLLNYANLWDDPEKDTAALAELVGHPERVAADGRVPSPGAPVARIAAPTIASGIDADGSILDVPLSGRDSAFVDRDSFVWSVAPAGAAEVVDLGDGLAALRASVPSSYSVALEARGSERDESSRDTLTVSVVQVGTEGAPPPSGTTRFYGTGGVFELLDSPDRTPAPCTGCHARDGVPGISVHFERCRGGGEGEDDFLYRSVLARVNLERPLDSLLLRKPSNGATDIADLGSRDVEGSQIEGYHGAGYVFDADEEHGRILGWILAGAPRGEPATPVPAGAPPCADD